MDQPAYYEIRVRGQLDEHWSDWLAGLAISSEQSRDGQPVTLLHGTIPDQSALHGILIRLRDLNAVLLSVEHEDHDPQTAHQKDDLMKGEGHE